MRLGRNVYRALVERIEWFLPLPTLSNAATKPVLAILYALLTDSSG